MSNIYNINENFVPQEFIKKLSERYIAKGYSVNAVQISETAYIIAIEKNLGGINTVLGLGESIKVNCFVNGNTLSINYTDSEWTSKIIGFAIGWILCFIPLITAIIGTVRQFSLPNDISNDSMMIISMLNK